MKLGAWMMMLTGMMIFLSFLGINTGVSGILEKVGITINTDDETVNADIEDTDFWDKLFKDDIGILAALVGVGTIIAGLFARGYDTSLVIVGLVIWVAITFTGTFWMVIKYTMEASGGQFWMTGIVVLIFGTLSVGFLMSCVDYFAGR